MVSRRTIPRLLFLFLLAGPGEARGRDTNLGRALEILDGDLGHAEAALALKARGFEPEALAPLLREWKPSGPPPVKGSGKVPFQGQDGRKTELWVHVPESYDPAKPMPLILALHGRGGNGRQMTDLCRAAAERYGYLVVAPSAKKFDGMLPIHPHWWKYTEDGFALCALRWARKHYHVEDDRVLLLGYSMGGFGTWNVGLRFPDRFFALAPFAGGISQAEYIGGTDRLRRRLLPNAGLLFLYFVHGSADRIVPTRFDRESHEALKKAGVEHVYKEIEGGRHLLSEVLAAARGDFDKGIVIKELFDALEKKRRAGLGAPFEFTALSAPASFRYLALDEAEKGPCRVHAETKGNAIRIETEGVRRITVYFDGITQDLGAPVTVEIHGKEAYRGRPAPTLLTLVESWRALLDRKRVFVARVTLDVPEKEEEGF